MPEIGVYDCDAPVKVVVHDPYPELPGEILGEDVDDYVGIPVIDNGIELHEWKDGPMSITRRAEVSFPMEGLDTQWYDYIRAYEARGGWQQATILMEPSDNVFRDRVTDLDLPSEIRGETTLSEVGHIPMMTGYIGAIGADGTNTGHLTIYGAYNLLGSIPVGERITAQDDLDGVFEWFTSTFKEKQPVFDELPYEIRGREAIQENLAEKYSEGNIDAIGLVTGTDTVNFSANRDTMADVARWMLEDLGIELRFEVQSDWSIKLVANIVKVEELFDAPTPDRFFEQRSRSEFVEVVNRQLNAPVMYNATSEGNLRLIENRALYEMKPYNTIILKGAEAPPVDAGDGEITVGGSGTYPEAKAKHPDLVERAGGELPLIRESKIGSASKLEDAARAQLKQLLDDASGGTMMFPLAPFIHPGDEILAQPVCDHMIDADVPDLKYEVQRAIHMVTPQPEDNTGTNIPRTEVSVTMSTRPSEIVTSSTMKDLKPSEDDGVEPQTYNLQNIEFNIG